jgi:hypothetical protein
MKQLLLSGLEMVAQDVPAFEGNGSSNGEDLMVEMAVAVVMLS